MTYALATNDRTAKKAAIKRASAAAQRDMVKLDRQMATELEAIYQQAHDEITASIMSYAGRDSTLRLEVLQQLLHDVDGHLHKLQQARNGLLDNDLLVAAQSGVKPFAANAWEVNLSSVADDVVRWAHTFTANDGLQLSDRIWRIDRSTKEAITQAIQSAIIQGHSASKTAQDFLSRDLPVPADVAQRAAMADAETIAKQIGADLLSGEGNAYANALRLFRTEINRAHGEAYMASGEGHPDFAGWRFLLSPSHPHADICDMHARANLYGLGPGVYPSRDTCPWPAHPNTLSFTEIVFRDEISETDRLGKTDRISWLKGQPKNMQAAVLGSQQKASALRADVLKANQIATPWNVLKERYIKQGIDIDAFKAERIPAQTINGTQIFGMDIAAFKSYADTAVADAPAVIRAVIDTVIEPSSIRVVPRGGSYFQGNGIVFDRNSMQPRLGFFSEYDVYRHEYGHYVDFWAQSDGKKIGRALSYTPDLNGGLLDTIVAARKSLEARTAAAKERRSRMIDEVIRMRDTNLADLFGALTYNKIGWGHSVEYLSRPGFAETEIFADLFDIYGRGDRTAWDYVTRELPDLAHRFVEILEQIAK